MGYKMAGQVAFSQSSDPLSTGDCNEIVRNCPVFQSQVPHHPTECVEMGQAHLSSGEVPRLGTERRYRGKGVTHIPTVTHTFTHMHTHAHTFIQTCITTHVHLHTCTFMQTCIPPTCSLTFHTHTFTYMHTHIHTRSHKHTCKTCTFVYIRSQTCTHMHSYTRSHKHAHMHS